MPDVHREGLVPAGIGHPCVRRFLDVKKHDRDGVFAIEGLWALRIAANTPGVAVEAVFVCPLRLGPESHAVVDGLRRRGTRAYEVSERVLARMVDRDGPDGLAAIARVPRPDVDGVLRSTGAASARVLVADAFDAPGNLGTVIRAADGAGAAAVLATESRLRLNHPVVVRASMATILSMPAVEIPRAAAAAALRRHGFRIVAADPAATCSYRGAPYGDRVAIVVGSERNGLPELWLDAADVVVGIPMCGTADSLNVGHAAALVLYEALHAHVS